MKFTKLQVENIFAYSGPSEIDLSVATDERNIIIVRGRNGAGKTSLLNAVKLLFLGSGDASLRRVGYGNTEIQRNQYVMGIPGRWYGVFNVNAKASGSPARVALDWTQNDGRAYRAQRVFRPSGSAFTEEFSITLDGAPLGEAERDATLGQLLPSEVVPFFFFDGEQIQSIADADIGREQAEIERLLGLQFIVHLNREIDSYSKERRRGDLPEDVRLALTRAENAQREAAAELEAAGRQRVTIEDEILELERTKQRLDTERNRLRTGISDADRRRMQGRIAVLKSQRETVAAEVAETIPTDVIWLTHPGLVREAFKLVEDYAGGDAEAARRLNRGVPAAVFTSLESLTPPIKLEESQRSVVQRDLEAYLDKEGFGAARSSNPVLGSAPPRTIRSLRDRFLVWSEQGQLLAGRHVDKLLLLRQLNAEYLQAIRDLDDAELATDDARERFNRITAELTAVEQSTRERADRVAEYRVAEVRAQRAQSEQDDEIRRLEAKYAERTRQNEAYQFSLRVKRALEQYRDRRRVQIKAAVQKRLNERVELLLGPSQLITSVTLDDQFVMTYFDVRGETVARHSISAGMRQLLAMALLWALKDQADRTVPVVIDTPLGRIDRENRALLMKDYFPKAGHPLILLPTSSEISDADLDQLSEHVCARYDIINSEALDAKLVPELRSRARGG